MLNRLTKLAMVISFFVFALFAIDDWLGQLLGWHDELFFALDLPDQAQPSDGLVVFGGLITLFGLIGLGAAYLAIWRILGDGIGQDFRLLARRLQHLAYGLIAFWLSGYLTFSVVRTLIAWQTLPDSDIPIVWDPFHVDLVFAISAVALIAISKMMERAWAAEDETQHFL